MKPIFKFTMTAVLLSFAASPAWSLDMAAARAAFDNHGCTSCHQLSGKLAGPSLKEIAKRYQGKKANAEVAARIREGSAGRWGDLPHPVLENLSAEDARLLADWILAGAR